MIEEKQMKTIKVVAAIICDDIKEKNKIFATARGYGELKGGWEFPGGKVEPGETSQQALIREIIEELDTEIKVGELIDTVEYDYPTFHLSMDCFWCEVLNGDLVLKEHEAAKWLTKEKLNEVAAATMVGGATLTKLLGTSAWYAPGAAGAFVVESIIHNQKKMIPCSVFLEGEYGESDICIGVPVILGKNGIEKIVELDLNADEKAKFAASAAAVHKTNAALKEVGAL